ncbi:hypothetical protein GCM10023323_55210 [Streptomyces thinghirensis]|uniref:Uncharacterized protein n=1 Tax=Streptomyces thinghirensis TaxID=551547 RepID=A0ABP9T9Y4_9ACTN
MLAESALNAVVAPASWRNRRRFTSAMGCKSLSPWGDSPGRTVPDDDGMRAKGVFQEQQKSGKGPVALV